MRRFELPVTLLVCVCITLCSAANAAEFLSHAPVRPLAQPSARPLGKGPAFFVDPLRGQDQNDGSATAPWKTIARGISQLKPGDTLVLRGGNYFEHVTVGCVGTREKPITIRSYPGEVATINGGLREFHDDPETAWEPFAEGAAGEFRSTQTYPELGGTQGGCNVLGSFADSMLPLHGYRWFVDLRDSSMEWDVEGKVDGTEGVYCGPGLLYDLETQRIYARFAPTNLKALGDDNYNGEQDPRKVPLIIAGLNTGPALTVKNSRWLELQDLVVCGARTATVEVNDCRDLTLEGMTIYGGASAMSVRGTSRLRVYHTACRGIAAPWTFRGHLKYRAIEARIFSASGWSSSGRENQDFELAYSEFTDCVDGVFIGNVRNVHFHHNLLDNVSDDGMFLTATTDYEGHTHGGGHSISQNLLSRCLTTFAFGVGHGRQKMTPTGRQTGPDTLIFRNVFDFRRPVHYQLPGPNDEAVSTHGRVTGDHGSPLWEPMLIYQNTIVESKPMRRQYYLADLAGGIGGGGRRRLFNNIAVQVEGSPGKVFPKVIIAQAATKPKPESSKTAGDLLDGLLDDPLDKPSEKPVAPDLKKELGEEIIKPDTNEPLPIDFQADGNLHWSWKQAHTSQSLLGKFRDSEEFTASKKLFASGWAAHDIVADPQFVAFSGDWREPLDLRLQATSPAVDASVTIPRTWPDPLVKVDAGQPDLGAIPKGMEPWRVGVRGRLTVFGSEAGQQDIPQIEPIEFPQAGDEVAPPREYPSAAVVQGYPAFDGALLDFTLTKLGVPMELHDRTWLDTSDYSKHKLVVIVGDLARAKMEPRQYTEDDFANVQKYLEAGGTLLIMRSGQQVFTSQQGRYSLGQLIGGSAPRKTNQFVIRNAKHPWLKHLDIKRERAWLNGPNVMSLRQSKGDALIGNADGGTASLLRVPIGKGQLIYLGWDISASLPHGRESSTVEEEQLFEEQMQILKAILSGVYADASS